MQAKDTPPKNEPSHGESFDDGAVAVKKPESPPTEYGGPKVPEPTRYGDWERKGRCVDF